MSIPKGLIIYTAKRHQDVYPMNIKYRHYSNMILLPPQAPIFTRERTIQYKSQTKITKVAKITKLVRHLDSSFVPADPKETQITRYFSKLNRIKTLFINVNHQHIRSDASEGFAIDLLQRAFRSMKDLQQVGLNHLESLRKDYGAFKNLLLQRSLRKLIVSPLKSTQYVNDLAPFMKLSLIANRRKCWPHLNYLEINLESFDVSQDYNDPINSTRGRVCNLLKFLQDFKSCDSLYKCAHFQLLISDDITENAGPEEYAAFDEILKMELPLTQISLDQGKNITSLFRMTQDLKDLQSLDLMLSGGFADNLEMNSLKKFSNLQQMSLVVECIYELDENNDCIPKANFSSFVLEKLQSITNLRSLPLLFDGDPSGVEGFLHKALSNLTELTYLSLRFPEVYDEEEDEEEKLSWPWLKQVFEAIGKMKKLKTFYLEFETFSLEGSSGIFKNLCQALENLTQLSSLHLEIGDAESIQDKDILRLASSLSKLTRMKSLNLRLHLWNQKFKSSTFVVLMDSIVKNLKTLSELNLKIDCVGVTKQCYQAIEEGIRQLKDLNKIRLQIGGQVERGVNLALLDTEVRKRMAGYVSGALEF